MKRVALIALLLLALPAFTKKKKDIQQAPLPSEILQAKTVLLVNGGGSGVAYDSFYQQMKQWGKYTIVGSPKDADIVIHLQYSTEHNGVGTVPIYNGYTKQTTYYSREYTQPYVILTIMDPKTGDELWTASAKRHLVRLSSHIDKETVKSVTELVDDMKARSK